MIINIVNSVHASNTDNNLKDDHIVDDYDNNLNDTDKFREVLTLKDDHIVDDSNIINDNLIDIDDNDINIKIIEL